MEEIEFFHKNWGPKVAYSQTSILKRTLQHNELDDKYMGLFTHRQIIVNLINGQNLYNYCLPDASKLKLGHNQKNVW